MSSFINFNNREDSTGNLYSAEVIKTALLKSETKSSVKAESLVKDIKEPISLNEALVFFTDKLGAIKQLNQSIIEINEGRVKQFEMDVESMIKDIKKGYGWIDPNYVEETWNNVSDSIDFELVKEEIYKRLIAAGVLAYSNPDDEEKAGVKVTNIRQLQLESVQEKFNKEGLIKALGTRHDGIITVKGKEYIIYNPDSGNSDNTDMWGEKTIVALNRDGDEVEFKYSDIERFDEAYDGNMVDFRYEFPMRFEEETGISPNAIKKISKKGKGFEVRTSSYMGRESMEKIGDAMNLKLVSYEKSNIVIAVYEANSVNENYEVIFSDGISQMKKFRNERQALDFMKKEIKDNKNLRDIAVYKPGMHSTTQTELVVAFWGDGSYLDNVSKRDSKLAAKKLVESTVVLDGSWIETKELDSVNHTRLIRWIHNELDNKASLTKAGRGWNIDTSRLKKLDIRNLINYLKSQDFLQEGFELTEKSLINEMKKPKTWDSQFAMKAIEAYEAGEFDPEDDKALAKWEKEYNGGKTPNPSFDTYNIIAYALMTGKKPDGTPIKESVEVNEAYDVELFWKGLSGEDKKIGRFLVSKKDYEALENDFGGEVEFDLYDDKASGKMVKFNDVVAAMKNTKYGKTAMKESLNEGRSINKIQKEWSEITTKMQQKAGDWKAAEGDRKAELLDELKALTARKKALESELDAAVAGKDKDLELVVSEGNAFGAARAEAIAKGEKEFTVDGETYPIESVDDEDKENAEEFVKESKADLWDYLMEKYTVNEDLRSDLKKYIKNNKKEIDALADQDNWDGIYSMILNDFEIQDEDSKEADEIKTIFNIVY